MRRKKSCSVGFGGSPFFVFREVGCDVRKAARSGLEVPGGGEFGVAPELTLWSQRVNGLGMQIRTDGAERQDCCLVQTTKGPSPFLFQACRLEMLLRGHHPPCAFTTILCVCLVVVSSLEIIIGAATSAAACILVVIPFFSHCRWLSTRACTRRTSCPRLCFRWGASA